MEECRAVELDIPKFTPSHLQMTEGVIMRITVGAAKVTDLRGVTLKVNTTTDGISSAAMTLATEKFQNGNGVRNIKNTAVLTALAIFEKRLPKRDHDLIRNDLAGTVSFQLVW
jgi:hypothetical protein